MGARNFATHWCDGRRCSSDALSRHFPLQIAVVSFNLPMPRLLMDFFSYFNFVSLNFFHGVAGDCLVQADYFDGLVVSTATPLLLLLVLLLCVISLPSKRQSLRDRLKYLWLTITYTVLPTGTTVSVNTFLCEVLDTHDPPGLDSADTRFLVSDYSLECGTPRHAKYKVYAVVCILLFPIGIPLARAFYHTPHQ